MHTFHGFHYTSESFTSLVYLSIENYLHILRLFLLVYPNQKNSCLNAGIVSHDMNSGRFKWCSNSTFRKKGAS